MMKVGDLVIEKTSMDIGVITGTKRFSRTDSINSAYKSYKSDVYFRILWANMIETPLMHNTNFMPVEKYVEALT